MKVLVTGACGGIGRSVCEYLLKKGVIVYAVDIQENAFNANNFFYSKVDITNTKSLKLLCEEYAKKEIVLDAIINIAGVFLIDSFIELSEEELQKIFSVNLFGSINVNKLFYPLLKKEGKIIITTSEVSVFDPMPFNGIYNTTKTALECYAKSLRQELNLLGQKVIVVRPGAFNTALSKGALEKTKELTDKTVLYKHQSSKFYNIVKMFMGKPSDPQKIANVYYKALTARGNKIVYKKHTNKLLWLMNILPHRFQCCIVKLMLKSKVKN